MMASKAQHVKAPAFPSASFLTPLERALCRFTRREVEALVSAAIDLLDRADGDPDLGPNGDELDGSMGEDDFSDHNAPLHLLGAGCPVADPGEHEAE